ncbi:MAG: diguanylate cyclase [Proteobacteria bacterium]|nr:diguanylate cyclase [Pseudomonadota bacterium]
MSEERDTFKDIISKPPSDRKSRDSVSDTVPVDLTPLAKQMLRAEEGGKKACLLVLDGIDEGTLIPLSQGTVIIGRSSSCDALLREEGISRHHARVELIKSDRITIEDLSSTNGVFIGGKRIKKATLKAGDKVLLGRRTMLRFVLEDNLDQLYEQEMYASSTRDRLTGLFNRKYLKQRMASDLSYAKRHGACLSFMIFTIDQLSEINHDYGHQTGDQVIVTVSQSVSGLIREEDVFARYTTEEFAIVAPGIDLTGGRAFGERVRKQIAREEVRALDESGKALKFTVSMGLVTVNEKASTDMDRVLSDAANNLSIAVKHGQNRVVTSQIIECD